MIAPAVPMHGWLSAQSTHTTGPGLQWSSRPLIATSPSTPMPGPDASSLAMNTHVSDVFSSGFKLRELREERRHQRDVAEAIGRAAAEKLIAVDCQAERVHFPSVGVGGDDVQVATNEAQHILGGAGAGILDDQVTSTLRVRHVFDLERTAVFLSVRREDLEAVLDGEIFLGDVRGAHARVLQLLHLTDEVAKQANEAFFVELQAFKRSGRVAHDSLRKGTGGGERAQR